MADTRNNVSQLEDNGLVWLSADAFRELGGVAHGFSTRLGGVSEGKFDSLNLGHARGDDPDRVKENYRRFCGALGADMEKMVFSNQVHRDDIRVCTMEDAGKGLFRERGYEADGLVTNVSGLPLVIFSADCLPVLLYDPVNRAIGACHCGWRGSALGIAKKTVAVMAQEYGSKPEEIHAAIGPGISKCCFETHVDVPDGIRVNLGVDAEEAITSLPRDKYLVDLKLVNRIWLEKAGVTPDHISVSDQCTCCLPKNYWSHRLVGQERGSMAALIQLI